MGYLIGRSDEVEHDKKNDPFGCSKKAEEDARKLGGAILGGVAGGALGAGLGIASSKKDVVLISPANRDFERLKIYARFKGEEPEFLQKIR